MSYRDGCEEWRRKGRGHSWDDGGFDTELSELENFFSASSKDEWITNLQSDHMLPLSQALQAPLENLILRRHLTSWRLVGNLIVDSSLVHKCSNFG
jgi:hypothetical protein